MMPSSNAAIHGAHNQPMHNGQSVHYPQAIQQLPPRSGLPGVPLPSQPSPMPHVQGNRPTTSNAPHSYPAPPFGNNVSAVGGAGVTFPSSYRLRTAAHFPSPGLPGKPWVSVGAPNSTPVQHAGDHPLVAATSSPAAAGPPDASPQSLSDWQEHATPDGRRYYYNKKTKQSSWEKPVELMTPQERADASSIWKEFTTAEGKKYYYNKITKESKWNVPEELKLAREEAEKAASQGIESDVGKASQYTTSGTLSFVDAPSATVSVDSSDGPSLVSSSVNTPSAVETILGPNGHSAGPRSSNISSACSPSADPAIGIPAVTNTSSVSTTNLDRIPSEESLEESPLKIGEEAHKAMALVGKTNQPLLNEKATVDEPAVFANKQEAKNAFKSLLESVNVQSDWTWDQAMRVIVNDKRYGALKTLGERKQAFNEYLGQRRKQEIEERRMRQKKAKEEFTKMLEESQDLTSSLKWSKAVIMFEEDERFMAVEKPKDRQELFESYLEVLQKKEKEKADEEYRRKKDEYWKFLESCDFIEVNSLWRKVQDRLEDDERCSCLEKIDRLEIFQDYIRYLETKEEEQRKTQKHQLRRVERKNRDEFRKAMEADVGAGVLTARTSWHDYCTKIRDSTAYIGVARNTSGSTPKDLFEDVVDELMNQYNDDRSRIKDVMKTCEINVTSAMTFEDFKTSISVEIGSPPISEINLLLVFQEQLDRAKEKEDKVAKKRQRLVDNFTDLLRSITDINASSTWEECRVLVEDSEEYREIGEERLAREIYGDHVAFMLEKSKEKERKHEEEKILAKKERERDEKEKRKEKEKKEKDRDKRKERSKKEDSDDEDMDDSESHGHKVDHKKDKDKDKERRHRKRHRSVTEDLSSDKDDDKDRRHRKRHDVSDDVGSDKDTLEDHKKSRRNGSDRKRNRKHEHEMSPMSDTESRHKRHKRDNREGSRRNGAHEELEDGELGEDGELQ